MNEQKTTTITAVSPIATGQGGGFFEQHVGAAWLGFLLVRATPPLFLDGQVIRVSFQTQRLGWSTDDLLVVAETGEHKTRKLACQIKLKFSVSSKNEDCKKTFKSFWADFESSHFDRALDRLCLITLHGTNNILFHLNSLLECATISSSSSDFINRLKTDGLINTTAKGYAFEIRSILEDNGKSISDEDFWQFLRGLSILNFDLNTNTRQTEALVKTLLAQTANGADKPGVARATWNELVTLASRAMPGAMDFSREDLPDGVRSAHEPVSNISNQLISTLHGHSSVVLNGVHTSIGSSAKLPRTSAVATSLEKLAANRILILSGAAGAGKSAVAKSIIESLNHQYFSFAFRAEEFRKSHLDEMLAGFGTGLTEQSLSALLAGQQNKIILVDSVERLLEASVRDAFTDLLRLVERDGTWKLIITCRSYSLDVVVASFFNQTALPFAIFNVPPLSDDELNEVERKVPKLARPLSSQKLRRVLQNPYVLDKAAQMPWSDIDALPEDEREFRRRFWSEIVRDDGQAAEGLPQRREQALTEVALRRAKALSLFARIDDLDPIVVSKLHQSDLISLSSDAKTLGAPAHDLLEDWTLLNWIDLQSTYSENEPTKLAEIVGTYPALRRSYRMWLTERSELDPMVVDSYLQSVLKNQSLSMHFRDDTIVSLLRSEAGADFISRNKVVLVANQSALLKRVIHLLRVACKTMPDWLAQAGHMQSSVMVPTGNAWPNALSLVKEQLSDFLPNDFNLALGLVEDWSNQISMANPYPIGFQDAASIGFSLLETVGGYRYDKERSRLFTVVSKNPNGNKAAFIDWMKPADDRDRDAEEFADFLIEGSDAWYCAKDLPDELIELTKWRLYVDEETNTNQFNRYHRLDVDEFFGLHSHRKFYPPSALRGPFLPLLQYHLRKGIDFIVEFVNRACDHYANPVTSDRLEEPWEVELTLGDGTICKQWHNSRLWQLYRGTSVGPHVLMCSLMALEHLLLRFAKGESKKLDSWLTYIISKSNNSALSAVITSVVVAHPYKFKGTAKILLSCRDFIEIDQNMSAVDRGVSAIQGMFPSLDNQSEIYQLERKESDDLAHRRRNLGLIALELQATEIAGDIQRMIDAHAAKLPSKDKQSEDERLWRLALHRMDLRKYSPKEATRAELASFQGKKTIEGDPDEKIGVILHPETPEQDLTEIIERNRPRIEANQSLISLMNWSWSCFTRDGKADSSIWMAMLVSAMEVVNVDEGDIGLAWSDAPATVAAICVRDHFSELTDDQKKWCLGAIQNVVARDRDSRDYHTIISRHAMSADRPGAISISAVLEKETKPEYSKIALAVLTDGMFHACEEVSLYAAGGVGQYLWQSRPELAARFVRALVDFTIDVDNKYDLENKKPYLERADFQDIRAKALLDTRKRFENGEMFDGYEISQLDFGRPVASETLKQFLHIFNNKTVDVNGQSFYKALAFQIHQWIAKKDDERTPFELLHACQKKLAAYVLGLSAEEAAEISKPIIELIDSKPREAADYLRDLIFEIDSSHQGIETFWHIWSEFADKARASSWIKGANSDHFHGDEIFRALFLGISWKKGARSWVPQKGYEDRIIGFFEILPASVAAIDHLAVYLYYVGDVVLPEGFIQLSKKLKEKSNILTTSNTIFCLEQVLQRHVYGTPQKLKSRQAIREAVITILDALVEKGSSAAFKMRDDFVTPLSGS